MWYRPVPPARQAKLGVTAPGPPRALQGMQLVGHSSARVGQHRGPHRAGEGDRSSTPGHLEAGGQVGATDDPSWQETLLKACDPNDRKFAAPMVVVAAQGCRLVLPELQLREPVCLGPGYNTPRTALGSYPSEALGAWRGCLRGWRFLVRGAPRL